MKKYFWFLAFFFVFSLEAAPARADVDQLCLRKCVETGGKNHLCLSQCSYGKDKTAVSPTMKKPSSPRVFDAPVPIGSAIVMKPRSASVAPKKDHACVMRCLQAGDATYPLCEERCTKTEGVTTKR
jgi:hypothetical protein